MGDMNEQPVGELSYEAARDELLAVVGQLEAGTASLAESMQLWERGEKLADHCQGWLSDARERLAAADPASIEAVEERS